MTRWFFKRRNLSFKHTQPLTIAVEKKIDRRIEKGKKFQVSPIGDDRFLVQGDTFECLVDLVRRTCSCGKFDLMKIQCRHAIKAAFSVGRQALTLIDDMYTTASWRSVYEETINPITVPEDSWIVPSHVKQAKYFLQRVEEVQVGERNADTRQLKTRSVRHKELNALNVANAVDVVLLVTIGQNVIEQYRIQALMFRRVMFQSCF